MYIKQRLFAVAVILGSVGLTYYNWNQLWQENRYSAKVAVFGPLGVVAGFFLLLFPMLAGKPESTRDKVFGLALLLAGMVAGLINWYLMDPGFFGM